MLVQASFRSVRFTTAFDCALVMPCNLRGGPSDSAFLLINLATVAIGKFGGSFLKFAQFSEELIFLEVELLKLSLKDDIGEMKLAILLVVILLLLFGFLIVLVGRMLEILFGVENIDFFVLLLIHKVYVLNFYYRSEIHYFNSALMSIYSRIEPFYYVVFNLNSYIIQKIWFFWKKIPFDEIESYLRLVYWMKIIRLLSSTQSCTEFDQASRFPVRFAGAALFHIPHW